MAKAKSVIDVMLGEGGGQTASERYADYLAIASVIANRSAQLGVTPEQVVQKQSEFNAYNKKMPDGVNKFRGLAEKAIAEVARNGPVHKATFYATPAAIGGLPPGLKEEVRTGSHIYKSDPQFRSINTSEGYKPAKMAYAQELSARSPFDAMLGPVTNKLGDQLIGPVPGSKPTYRDPFVSAPNYRAPAAAPAPSANPNSMQQMYSQTGRTGAGVGRGAGGMAVFSSSAPIGPAPGFQAPQRNGIVTSAPLNAPGVPYTAPQRAQIQTAVRSSVADALNSQKASLAASRPALSSTYSGVPGVQIGVNSLDGTTPTYSVAAPKMGTPINPSVLPAPMQSITPVQAVPGIGDVVEGRVARAKTVSKDAMPGDKARGVVGKIGGSLVGGILAGPLGGLIGGMLGSYAGKTGFRDAPLNINNIGAGSQGVYSVYNGAPRGTQAMANNGGMVTSLGNGGVAYTGKSGVTTTQDKYGNHAADWSGRDYGKSSKK